MRRKNNEFDYEKEFQIINCNLDDIYENIKVAVNETGDFKKALCLCDEIMKIDSNFRGVNFYAAYSNDRLGNISKSEYYYKRHLVMQPDSIVTINNLAGVLCRLVKQKEAVELFQRVVANIEIDQHEFFSNYLLYLNYCSDFDEQYIFKEHLKYSKLLNEKNREKGFKNDLNPNKKLKIGYVSNDFRLHSVAYFILSQIALHDKKSFEVFCYSDVKSPDFITEQIASYADNFKVIHGVSNEQVAKLIENDGIDILFDLGGHLGINRLPVFAVKPAPMQITAIGYPNTTGLKNMDYRITDYYCDPHGESDKYYTEKLIRMKKSFLCYRNFARAPKVKKVHHDNIVFCSYNNSSKLNKATIEVWCEILKKVENSILVLKSNIFFDEDEINEMKGYFADNEVESERISLITMHPSLEEHLNSYNKVDIALDTFPYNGTTTTCEALFMGVPLVTLCGQKHASRVGYSILKNLDLNDLISFNKQQYIEKTVALANNKGRLKYLNENLRQLMMNSPIMDSLSYTHEMEEILRNIWSDWTNTQWKIYINNSNNKEILINNFRSVCGILNKLNSISYNCYNNNYDLQLSTLLCEKFVEIFDILLQAKLNDSEINSLVNITNKGLDMLMKLIYIKDYYKTREIINQIINPVFKRINDKFKFLY